MKIRINPKAHAYVFMRTSPGGKYHIAFNIRPHHTVETCHERVIQPAAGWQNEIDKSLVCKRCLRHVEAWEEVVADKAPEEWQDLDSQPITTGPLTGGHHEIHTPNWSIVALDAGGYKVLVEGTEYVKKFKFEPGDMLVDNQRNLTSAINEVARLKSEMDELRALREEDVKAYSVIQEERDELKSKGESLRREFGNLMQVTRNHTLDNIATIIEVLPSADELEGRSFTAQKEYSYSHASMVKYFFTPIVEYIPTEEITDELPDKHGRIPCEFSDDGIKWYGPQLLIEVIDTRFRIHQRGLFSHCRIKKSDLEESAK